MPRDLSRECKVLREKAAPSLSSSMQECIDLMTRKIRTAAVFGPCVALLSGTYLFSLTESAFAEPWESSSRRTVAKFVSQPEQPGDSPEGDEPILPPTIVEEDEPAPEPEPEPQPPQPPQPPSAPPAGPFDNSVYSSPFVPEPVDGYVAGSSVTATRVDVPLSDIPFSVQVVPRQVLEDQQIIRIDDALDNVSGVTRADGFGRTTDDFVVRGFRAANLYRNGFRFPRGNFAEAANIDRIEVLKGPASIFFGQIEAGGIINYVTKKPLNTQFLDVDQQFGSFELFRTTVDANSPLDEDGNILFRFNMAYENWDTFRDFTTTERVFAAPTLTLRLAEGTYLDLEYNYFYDDRPLDRGLVLLPDNTVPNIPFSRRLDDPFVALDPERQTNDHLYSATLYSEITPNLRGRATFLGLHSLSDDFQTRLLAVDQAGNLTRRTDGTRDRESDTYYFAADLAWEIPRVLNQTVVLGVDRFFDDTDRVFARGNVFTNFNIFNPVYGIAETEIVRRDPAGERVTWTGLYFQDLIQPTDRLTLLLGGRYDWTDQENFFNGPVNSQEDEQFTGRAGFAYELAENWTAYGSFAESFTPQFTGTFDPVGNPLPPELGQQWEGGLKFALPENQFFVTLSGFHIEKQNVAVPDPDNVGASLITGEQRSQGFEADFAGQLTENLSTIISYAYIDARITDDTNPDRIGNRLINVPYNSASFWFAYNRPCGPREENTIGGGVGTYLFGERLVDINNNFSMDGYTRVDLGLWYRTPKWRFQVNIDNLFDEEFLEASGGNNVRINPGAPIQVFARVGYTR